MAPIDWWQDTPNDREIREKLEKQPEYVEKEKQLQLLRAQSPQSSSGPPVVAHAIALSIRQVYGIGRADQQRNDVFPGLAGCKGRPDQAERRHAT